MGMTDQKRELKDSLKKYKAAARKYKTHRSFIKGLLGYCPCCGRYFRYPVTTERRNSQYVNEAVNWLTACDECHFEDNLYFEDLWNTYYSSIF